MTYCPLVTMTWKLSRSDVSPWSKTRQRATLLLPTWIYSCQSVGNGQLHTSLYDKRDDFNFHITNPPFLSSNIPSSPAYGVFISQLIWYLRASSSYEMFYSEGGAIFHKLLGQGYVKERLRSSLRKFYGRYGDLIEPYEAPSPRILHDILDADHLQWHPPLIRHYTNFWPYYWYWPYNRIWLFT